MLSPSLKSVMFLLMAGVLFTSLTLVRAVGDTIAFSSKGNIYTMNTDGTNLIELARGSSPSWSPDGTKILFSFGLGRWLGDVTDIYIVDANGANRVNLTHGRHKVNHSPVVSPDGKRIAFASYRDDNYEIYVMDADGNNPKNLTLHLDDDTSPVWSPDGTKIAFGSRQVREDILNHSDIFVMKADGTNRINLTRNPHAFNNDPSWSPDGNKIAYSAFSNVDRVGPGNAHMDIFVMNADGTQPGRLTEDAPLNIQPSWSSDGKKIAFSRAQEDDPIYCDIYMMNADGTNLVNLTQTHLVGEFNPSWKPTPFSVSSRGKLSVAWGTVKQKR